MSLNRVLIPAVTEQDVDVLARTLYGEARGEGVAGMEAVACVIRNRVNIDIGDDFRPDWWGEGYAGVCQRPWQFSCWNQNDPNREKLLALDDNSAGFRTCIDIAYRCVRGMFPDVTRGSDHYCTRAFRTSQRGTSHWAAVATIRAHIGNHVFFKLG